MSSPIAISRCASAAKTGHDPRTFTGLVDLLCILELTD
jgi:hypothetical protein